MAPPPIDYQPPLEAMRERDLPFSVGGLIAGLVITFLLVGIGVLASRFEQIFRDFNIALPLLTRMVLGVCHFVQAMYFIPLAAIPVATAFLPKLAQRKGTTDTTERRIMRFGIGTLIVLFLAGLIVVVSVIALFMPMVSLMQGMNGGTKP
jgi:hypothetical protein